MTLAAEYVPKTWGRSSSAWRKIRAEAYRRDMERNAPCWICGKPINYAAKAGEPDAWEPDHKLGVKDFPQYAHDLANIFPSHSRCNRQRGAKDKAAAKWREELGEPSENWGI